MKPAVHTLTPSPPHTHTSAARPRSVLVPKLMHEEVLEMGLSPHPPPLP